jgi:hypothetical protein
MRLKVVLPAVIVLLVAIAILLWRHPNPVTGNSGSPVAPLVQPNVSINPQTNIAHNEPVPVSSATPPNTSQPRFDRNNPDSIRKYMESQNVPVEFYGQTVDQDGNPISGVKISVKVRHWVVVAPIAFGAEGQSIPLDGKSDAAGRFELQGATGDNFDIESIQRDGYEVEPGQRTYGATSGSFQNPIIFKMWNTNIHEQLISGEKKFQIAPDGRPYFINLNDGKITESAGGDLKVWVKYEPQTISGQANDWFCEIDVVNGGLIEEPLGTTMYMAPMDGYTPSFQLQQQISNGQYGLTGEKHFFVMLKNGQEYGSVSVNLYAPYTDQIPGLIRLSYAVNPSGSRVLR